MIKKKFKKIIQICLVVSVLLPLSPKLDALSLDTSVHVGGGLSNISTEGFEAGAITVIPSIGVRLTLLQDFGTGFSFGGYLDPRYAMRGYEMPGGIPSSASVTMNYFETSFGAMAGFWLGSLRFGVGIGVGYGKLLSVEESNTGYTNEELLAQYADYFWYWELPLSASFWFGETFSLDFSFVFSQGITPVLTTLYREYQHVLFDFEIGVTYRLKLF